MNLILKLSVLLTATMVLVSCKGKSSSGPYDDDLYPDDELSSGASSSSLGSSSSSSSGISSSSSQGAQSSSSLELYSSSSYEQSSSSRPANKALKLASSPSIQPALVSLSNNRVKCPSSTLLFRLKVIVSRGF